MIQGTREEIAAQLETLSVADNESLTLIVPGEEVPSNGASGTEQTLADIVAPLQADFETLGMNDEEHADWIESLVSKARTELNDKEQGSHG